VAFKTELMRYRWHKASIRETLLLLAPSQTG